MLALRPPARPTGPEAVRGHRVFGARNGVVTRVEATWGEGRFAAERRGDGWTLDGEPAGVAVAAALGDLVDALVGLRALDAFRPRDGASFGLDTPRGVIALTRAGRVRRVAIGGLTASGSAFYARRVGDARVLQVGSGIASAVERVLYARDRQRPESG